MRYRSRLFEQGYIQIPGVDFTKRHPPVVTDIIVHVVILMGLINKWDSHNIDVETSFYTQFYNKKYT